MSFFIPRKKELGTDNHLFCTGKVSSNFLSRGKYEPLWLSAIISLGVFYEGIKPACLFAAFSLMYYMGVLQQNRPRIFQYTKKGIRYI